MNSFLSTSDKRPIALFYMGDKNQRIDLERVLFEIDADPTMATTKPFADISSYSSFADESEVLFMLGSIFRLDNITRDADQVWIIQMTLCSDSEHDLKQVLADMKNQSGIGETNFHTLGKLLWNMGKLDLAEKCYNRLLNEFPSNNPLLSTLYAELSKIASQRRDYNKSVQLHKKSLEIKEQFQQTDVINNDENNIDMCKFQKKETIVAFKKSLNIKNLEILILDSLDCICLFCSTSS
jgi:tetratricopeptide (TPR) repeat protein